MSNFLLRNPDCVFIHIPKTGGSSIRNGLWLSRYEGPFLAISLALGTLCLSLHLYVIHLIA
jgi:hypothetical protein